VFDTLIRKAHLIDGTGVPGRQADVGLRSGRIETIADCLPVDATRVVDAGGLALCPGFIDAHSHSDAFVLLEPDAPSKVSQGVTTEVMGNCGASAAPIFGQGRLPSDWAVCSYPSLRGGRPVASATGPTWSTVADYRALFDQVRPAVNAVLLVGHNLLRAGGMGYASRPATSDEQDAMSEHLARAMDEGASGLSTGLIYQPGRYSAVDEVLRLARTAEERGGFYATHLRSEGDRLLEALDEALEVARIARIRVQISHLKTSGEKNWGTLDAVVARIEAARAQGLFVHADRYPYVAGGTDLDVVLPDWAVAGGRDAILARLADAATRARVADELDAMRPRGDWSGVRIGGTVHPDLHALRGLTIPEVADAHGMTPGQAIIWILHLDQLRTGAFFFGMSEDNLRRILAQPWVMVGSDASIRSPRGPLSADHPHPRAYGTFPRFLRLVQDETLLALPEAIRRLTSLPADAFGLRGRGRVVPGAAADLVLLDPEQIHDSATFSDPHRFSTGIRRVWVNGHCCFEDGRFTGDRAGQFLRAEF
jgi:N-acyl-D-amino-acid deacylase